MYYRTMVEEDMASVQGSENFIVMDETELENPIFIEIKSESNKIEFQRNENQGFASEKGEGSSVVLSREAPILRKESRMPTPYCCNAKKLKSVTIDCELGCNEKIGLEKKLCRQDRIELGRLFQGAVSSQDQELAESLILVADPQTLNDALCITVDSIWFLRTEVEFNGITGFIKKIIANGAYDFTRAALRTSFLASCVSACQSRTMSLADTVTVMAQRYNSLISVHSVVFFIFIF